MGVTVEQTNLWCAYAYATTVLGKPPRKPSSLARVAKQKKTRGGTPRNLA